MAETKAELREKIRDLEAKIEDLECELDSHDDLDLEALKEIIKQVEYKRTNWRKLDTAEDVVKAIRKEVLGE